MSINNSIVFVAERASSKLIFETPAGLNKISSVTTLVKAKMDDEGSSTGDAWAAVASDLGVDENLDLDSNEVKAAGEKITAVMAAMITAIGGKTDLTLTALQSISLIMNEINKELAAIAAGTKTAEAIAKEKITDVTSDNLKKQADTVVASKPTTLTMGDLITSENGGLPTLELMFEDNIYKLQRQIWRTSQMVDGTMPLSESKQTGTFPEANNGDFPAKIDADGRYIIPMGDANFTIPTVSVTPLKGKTITASSPFKNQQVSGFADGAKMYNMLLIKYLPIPTTIDMDCIRNFMGGLKCGQSDYTTYAKKKGNSISGEEPNGELPYTGTITLGENNTFTWESSQRPGNSPFSTLVRTVKKGKYTQEGEGKSLVVKFTADDGSIYIFISTSSDGKTGALVEFSKSQTAGFVVFNDKAMETIRSNWNENNTPNWNYGF